jgi:SAM-dependent methyltransferase
MVEIAREKAAVAGVRIPFELGDAEDLSMADESFDVVHARHLMWTLPNPRRALAEWRRVLRPGGLLLITEAHRDGVSPSPGDRLRSRCGRTLMRLFRILCLDRRPIPRKPRGGPPGRGELPWCGGFGSERLTGVLREVGFDDVDVRDLLRLRERGRAAMTWYRRWANPPKHSYYAVWGRRSRRDPSGAKGEAT